jgi:hypothetical protein
LNAYLGVGAIESGSAVYPDADFCADPEAICKHPKTEELRWVLAMLEWTDRIQSYNNLNDAGVMKAGWNYRDQLTYFANEYYADGVIEEYYEEGVFDKLTFVLVPSVCRSSRCVPAPIPQRDRSMVKSSY